MQTRKIKLTESQIKELNEYKTTKKCSASELKRIIAIILLDRGNSSKLINDLTDYNQKYVFELRKKYLNRGINSLKDRRKAKPKALLTENQRQEIIKTLTTLSPKDFGFNEDYWKTCILARLIKEQYNVQYKSRTSLYLFFKEAKFTYHKPDKQYKNRNQETIDIWVANNAPVIQEALEDKNSVVLVADEMMLSTQTTTQKIWIPRGEYPKIDVSNKREVRCVYGVLNIKTTREHAFKTMRANSEESCNVLDKIGDIYKGKKITLIWDNAPWHKSVSVKKFLNETKHSFHLIQLPPYAPDLNPQEHVWKSGRTQVTHNHFIEDIDKATNQFIRFLNNSFFDYKFL